MEKIENRPPKVDRLIDDRSVVRDARARAFLRVLKISNALMVEKDLNRLLHLIVEVAVRETHADRGSLMLLDPDRQELSICAAIGLPEGVIETTRVAVGQGISGWVARTQKPLVLIGRVHPIPEIQEAMRNEQIDSGLCVPVIHGELIGVLNVSRLKKAAPLTQSDLELFSILGGQAAIAIQNARILEELRQQLLRSSRLACLGELAASVAHEVNNSLQSIINFGTLLHEDMKEGNVREDDVKAIETGALRARNIMKTLLGIARTERTTNKNVDINNLLRTAVTLVWPSAKRTNITIVENYYKEPLLALGSAEQLTQVFLNLFTNAVDSMPRGGKIEIESALHNKHIIVTVADTGVGIPHSALNRIFNPWFTTKRDGTGLGLTLSLSIVQQHGGTIVVDSVENQGSRFTTTLPRLELRREEQKG